MRLGEARIEFYGLPKQRPRCSGGLERLEYQPSPACEQIVRLEICCSTPWKRSGRGRPPGKRAYDPAHDLILTEKDIGQIAVIALGPQRAACGGVDQLGADPHPPRGPPDATLDDIAHAKLA